MHETKTSFGTRGGTWPARRRILCHGGTDKLEGTETIGMAFSTDLVHWTPVRTGAFFLFLELFTLLSFISGTFRFVSLAPQGPGPAATAMMHYADGSTRKFAKRERPALLLDEKGFPLVLYNGVQVRRVLSTVLSTVPSVFACIHQSFPRLSCPHLCASLYIAHGLW